jgi:hypothetical protein
MYTFIYLFICIVCSCLAVFSSSPWILEAWATSICNNLRKSIKNKHRHECKEDGMVVPAKQGFFIYYYFFINSLKLQSDIVYIYIGGKRNANEALVEDQVDGANVEDDKDDGEDDAAPGEEQLAAPAAAVGKGKGKGKGKRAKKTK